MSPTFRGFDRHQSVWCQELECPPGNRRTPGHSPFPSGIIRILGSIRLSGLSGRSAIWPIRSIRLFGTWQLHHLRNLLNTVTTSGRCARADVPALPDRIQVNDCRRRSVQRTGYKDPGRCRSSVCRCRSDGLVQRSPGFGGRTWSMSDMKS